jgi:hypothetical protein
MPIFASAFNPGNGVVSVTETIINDCVGNSSIYPVSVNECTGIFENATNDINVFPNLASDVLNIMIGVTIWNLMIY